MTHRFQLLVGTHREIDGTIYRPGDVITTRTDLAKVFGSEKFRRLPNQDTPAKIEPAQDEPTADEPTPDEPTADVEQPRRMKRHKRVRSE